MCFTWLAANAGPKKIAKNHHLRNIAQTNEGQIWCARADARSTLTRQISSECVHCVRFGWPKTTILGNLWHFRGSCTDPFCRWAPNSVCYSRPTVYVYMPNFVSIGLFCRLLAPINSSFCPFWTSTFSDVDSWRQFEKAEHHYPTA